MQVITSFGIYCTLSCALNEPRTWISNFMCDAMVKTCNGCNNVYCMFITVSLLCPWSRALCQSVKDEVFPEVNVVTASKKVMSTMKGHL